VLLFFLLHVIPQFSSLFSDFGSDPGALVKGVMGLSAWLVANQDWVGLAALASLGAGLLAWRIGAVRAAVIATALRLPLISSVWTLWRTTRFLSNLAVLVSQGVPMTEAMPVLGAMLGADAQAALATVRDKIRRGGRLHEALAATGLFPTVAIRMLRVGEETGELAKAASDGAALYGRKLEQRLEQITGLVGPVAIVTIAGLIGGLMATIMTALISINETVQ
jgi:general secretion pathway protein F